MYDIDTLVHGDVSTVVLPFSACSVGENIAVSSRPNDTSLFDLWMGSPGHYRNIVDPTFDSLGVGVVTLADDTIFVTQQFQDIPEPVTRKNSSLSTGAAPGRLGLSVSVPARNLSTSSTTV